MRHILEFASSLESSWEGSSARRAGTNLALFVLLAFLAVLGAGCEHDAFVLDITVDGDGFQRQLTAWHVRGSSDESEPQIAPIDSEELARLEQVYGDSRTIEDGRKHVFAGHFRETHRRTSAATAACSVSSHRWATSRSTPSGFAVQRIWNSSWPTDVRPSTS